MEAAARCSVRGIALIIAFNLLANASRGQVTSVRLHEVDSTIVQEAGLIALIRVQGVKDDRIYYSAEIVFKGGLYMKPIYTPSPSLSWDAGQRYLVFAELDQSGNPFLDPESRVVTGAKMEEDKEFLLSRLDCRDPAYDASRSTGACTRELDPVCGCDGKEYGNPCEARRQGIQIYTFGRCP